MLPSLPCAVNRSVSIWNLTSADPFTSGRSSVNACSTFALISPPPWKPSATRIGLNSPGQMSIRPCAKKLGAASRAARKITESSANGKSMSLKSSAALPPAIAFTSPASGRQVPFSSVRSIAISALGADSRLPLSAGITMRTGVPAFVVIRGPSWVSATFTSNCRCASRSTTYALQRSARKSVSGMIVCTSSASAMRQPAGSR